MLLKCIIGSLRLSDGTEYSEGDTFSLDDKKTVQSLLHSGYVQEAKEKPIVVKAKEKPIVVKPKSKTLRK